MRFGRFRQALLLPTFVLLSLAALSIAPTLARAATALTETPGQEGTVTPNKYGLLDCNGQSPTQHLSKVFYACADVHDPASDDGRFTDNGEYVGHDEPDLNFTSSKRGSGNDTTWTFRLGKDPTAAPTDSKPGSDVSRYFELTPALWLSMPLCDPQSYPILPCTPDSNKNAPSGQYPGGGSAFLELQFYPPGFAPWIDSISVDNTHWAAAMVIWSLESTQNFTNINPDCEEPGNFSFIQSNGVPPGPPSPQLTDAASSTPNVHTLLMNEGDRLQVHVDDAAVPGNGGKALEVVIDDLTTGKTGYMQASAANGFMNTSIIDCSGTPFNFEPEYNTAAPQNVVPWAANNVGVSASFETGHFEPCTSITGKRSIDLGSDLSDTYYTTCKGPYESAAAGGDGSSDPEISDAPCYPKGDTHGGLAPPDEMTGCTDEYTQNGDLDFDGPPYWTEWPTSRTPTTTPSTFMFDPPTTGSPAAQYTGFNFDTDLAFSEVTTCDPESPQGCTVPPPNAPGNFYPYWTLSGTTSHCYWEFGNMTNGDSFGEDAQYGSPNPNEFPEFDSAIHKNTCTG
jgi:hypothetical protein